MGLTLIAHGLLAQSILDFGDRQELLLKERVLRRMVGEPAFRPVVDVPELQLQWPALGRIDHAWDGHRAYLVWNSPDRKRMASLGTQMPTSSGRPAWFWSMPTQLPWSPQDQDRFLAAWDASLIFLLVHQEEKKQGAVTDVPKKAGALVRFDLITGRMTELLNHLPVEDVRATCLIVKGTCFFITASGRVVSLDLQQEPWAVKRVTENFWNDAGITLCRDTGSFRNPFFFGKAFLDQDGSILWPAQVFLPLDRVDIDRAWSRLPQTRKTELVDSGQWPVPEGREIGWKSETHFLRFNPVTSSVVPVAREWFKDLIVEEDVNFIIRRFKDFEPTQIYTVMEGRILPIEATVKDKPPVTPPARDDRGEPRPIKKTGEPTRPESLSR